VLVRTVLSHVVTSATTKTRDIPCTTCGGCCTCGWGGSSWCSCLLTRCRCGWRRRAGAELDDEFLLQKCWNMSSSGVPALRVQLCKQTQIIGSCQHILYNRGCPKFRSSNHHESAPLQRRVSPIYHNESYLFATPGTSPQQTENLAEITAFC
jgi:hypothetical protein